MFSLLFTIIGILVIGIIFIQVLTLILRFLNNGGFKVQKKTKPSSGKQEQIKPIKGSPFSVQDTFKDYPTLNKLNNEVIGKYQQITANQEVTQQYRSDLFGLLDVHKRLVDQWRENVGLPGYEMISVSTEILIKINQKLDAIIKDMYRESVDKLKIENKVLDHIK